jgi:DNA-binding transcriptional regulator GbsR (MarR family)
MSTLQNEMILEDLFEEMLEELQASQVNLSKSVRDLEAMAADLATQRFEDLSQ